MEPFKYHIFVCTQAKPEGMESCAAKGAEQTLAALRREIARAGLDSEVQVTTCGCLGLCEKGPNLIVYPEGTWYAQVKAEDVAGIVSEHLKLGRPVARLARPDASSMKKEISEHFAKVKAIKEFLEKSGLVPEEVNAVMRGFMESRIMLTAVELDLFSAIGVGATAAQAAKTVKAHPRSTEAVLNALVALKLLTKNGEVFYNTPLTARYLVAGGSDDSRLALMHMVHLWRRWSTLTAAVREGTAVAKEALKKRGKDQTAAFIAAMHKNASFAAKAVVPAIDLGGVGSLLDVGGGSGAYAIAFARKKPGMKVTVFDLPGVIPLTKKYIAAADLADAIRTQAGDMTKDKLGAGYDLVFVSAICHMFSPKENLALFKRIKSALNPGGRVVIQDFVLDNAKTSPRMAAVFALNMLVNTKGGGTYSGEEYLDWLEQAGFAEGKIQPLPGPTRLAIGKKS